MTVPTTASALTTDKTHLPAASLSRVTPTTRSKAAERGEAMKDGSYPIRDGADLKRAVAAFGRAKDKGAAKRHIIRRAKALDRIDVLPETWKVLALKEFPGAQQQEDCGTPIVASATPGPFAPALDETLAAKADRHNAIVPEERRVSVAKLKVVYRRGVADFGDRACVTPDQHGHARVNSFLALLATGAPLSPTYTCDNDLLPRTHPVASAPPPFGSVI